MLYAKDRWYGLMVLCFLVAACDFSYGSGGPEYPPPQQTEILAVTALPDTIAVRDTTLLTCVIRDSLDTNFQFRWSIGEGELIGGNERQVQWVAPGKAGTYSHRVEATNGSDRSAPSAWVTVVVVDP